MVKNSIYLFLGLGLLSGILLVACKDRSFLASPGASSTPLSIMVNDDNALQKTTPPPVYSVTMPSESIFASVSVEDTRIELSDPARWIEVLRLREQNVYGFNIKSPDGTWIATNANKDPDELKTIHIRSTADEAVILDYTPGQEVGYQTPDSPIWSPDSTSMVIFGADMPQPYCYFRRLIILQIDPINLTVTPSVFELPGDKSDCIVFAWSPDGTMLAVNSENNIPKTIFVLNKQGQPLHEISIPLAENEMVSTIEWASFGFFYSVYIAENRTNKRGHYELRELDLDSPTHESVTVAQMSDWNIIHSDPTGSSNLLMSRRLFDQNDVTPVYPIIERYEYGIFNTESMSFKKLELDRGNCSAVRSPTQFTVFACSSPNNLWFFNWEKQELSNYGEYQRFLGWYDELQGFLILQGIESFEVIQPQ